jgi:hypothetical protein
LCGLGGLSAGVQFHGLAGFQFGPALGGAFPPFGVTFGALGGPQGGEPTVYGGGVAVAELPLTIGAGRGEQDLPGCVLGLLDPVGGHAAVDLPHHGRVPECGSFPVFAGLAGDGAEGA